VDALTAQHTRDSTIRRWATQLLMGVGFLGLACAAFYLVIERANLERLLTLDALQVSFAGRTELALITISKSTLLLTPALLLGRTAAGLPRKSQRLRLIALTVAFWILILDQSLFFSVGRHLIDMRHFIHIHGAGQTAGDSGVWIAAALRGLIVAFGFALLAYVPAIFSERYLAARAKRASQSVSGDAGHRWPAGYGIVACVAVLVILYTPHLAARRLDEGMRERAYGTFLIDVRLPELTESGVTPLARVEAMLRREYRKRYSATSYVMAGPEPRIAAQTTPPIAVIVLESWRKDALSAEHMPRLWNWTAQHAHRFANHSSGTHSSQAGMFELLYGKSNLAYHATLDAKVPPLLFRIARGLGYEVGYFSGHPLKWLRREEFLAPHTVDRWVHDDSGEWTEWDQRALAGVVDNSKRSDRTLSLSFLMSSHFEYRYPPQYERHTPVAQSKMWTTDVLALGESDRIPHWNRYLNSMAFLDDLVTDTVQALPEDTLIVITGDHGESFFDGGMYGHGYMFSRVVLEVPMIVRFPKVAGLPERFLGPAVVEQRTLHRDVLGWIVDYLGGAAQDVMGFQGQGNWQSSPAARPVLHTCAASERGSGWVLTLLEAPGWPRLRINLRNDQADLRVLGFEHDDGTPLLTPRVDEPLLEHLREAFATELEAQSR
jgi:hypothetical protein